MRPYHQYISTCTSPLPKLASSSNFTVFSCVSHFHLFVKPSSIISVSTHCEMPPMATTNHSQRYFQKGSPQYPKWASYTPPQSDERRRQVTLKKGLLLTLAGLVLFAFTMGSWFPSTWFVCLQSLGRHGCQANSYICLLYTSPSPQD